MQALHDCADHFRSLILQAARIRLALAFCSGLRPEWLISGVLNASCKFQKIPCPNKQYGCTKLLLQSQWEEHLERECRFIPVQCPWCFKKVHNKDSEVSKLKAKHVKLIVKHTHLSSSITSYWACRASYLQKPN